MATEEELQKRKQALEQAIKDADRRFVGLENRLKSVTDTLSAIGDNTTGLTQKLKELGLSQTAITDVTNKMGRSLDDATDSLKKNFLEIEDEIDALKRAADASDALVRQLEVREAALLKAREATGANTEEIDKQIDRLRKLKDASKDNSRASKTQAKELLQSDKLFESLANSIGLTGKMSGTTFGKMAKGAMGSGAAIKGLGAAASRAFMGPAGWLSLAQMAMEATLALGAAFLKVQNDVRKATYEVAQNSGGIGRQTEALAGARDELMRYGLGTAEAAKAMTDLNNQVFGFIGLGTDLQIEAAAFAGSMEMIGVNTADTANIVNSLSSAAGGLEQGLVDSQSMISRVGLASRNTTGGMAQGIRELNQALPDLRKFGSGAEDVFLGMKAIAEETAISMDTLLSMSKKMDTFTGAADVAGQLNALMGMQLSTTELLMASDEDRLKMIKAEFDATGRSFEQMGRFEKIALSQAAGFQSVDEAARFFNASLGDIAANELKMKLQAQRQEEFNEAIMAAQDPLKRLAQQMARLITVSAPLIDIFTTLIENLVTILDGVINFKEGGIDLTNAAFGLNLAIGALSTAIAALLLPFTLIGGLIAGAVYGFYQLTAAIAGTMRATTEENSLSFQQLFLTLPDLIDAAVAGIMKMVSAFSSLGQMVRGVGGLIKQFLPDFLGGEANINVAGATTTSGVLTANGAVSRAATNRNVVNNTATTVNNGGTIDTRPQKAQINMTIDLGRNRVFQRAVQDVLYMEDK
jgi:hypothetical protein